MSEAWSVVDFRMMVPVPRVLVISSSTILERVSDILNQAKRPFCVVKVETLNSAITYLRHFNVDLALYDPWLEDSTGADTVGLITKETTAPVLVLSRYSDNETAVRCIREGAAGFIVIAELQESLEREVLCALERNARLQHLRDLTHGSIQRATENGADGRVLTPYVNAIELAVEKITVHLLKNHPASSVYLHEVMQETGASAALQELRLCSIVAKELEVYPFMLQLSELHNEHGKLKEKLQNQMSVLKGIVLGLLILLLVLLFFIVRGHR